MADYCLLNVLLGRDLRNRTTPEKKKNKDNTKVFQNQQEELGFSHWKTNPYRAHHCPGVQRID